MMQRLYADSALKVGVMDGVVEVRLVEVEVILRFLLLRVWMRFMLRLRLRLRVKLRLRFRLRLIG